MITNFLNIGNPPNHKKLAIMYELTPISCVQLMGVSSFVVSFLKGTK